MEQRGEADRLQRHRLAAGVRAADHERAQRRRARDRSAPPPPDRAADGGRRPAAPRPRSPPARRASHARRPRARAPGRSLPTASTSATTASARSPTAPRELAQDPLDLLALGGGGLRLAVVEVDDVERLDEQRLARVGGVVDDAGHAAPGARLHGEHRPAAALGDEILLQVLAQAARPDELLAASRSRAAGRCAARTRSLRSCGEACVAQIGAVLLDRALDRLRERRERRVDRGGELAQERRGLLGIVEGGTRAERPADRVGHVPQRPGCEHAAAAPRAPRARGRRAALRAAARPRCRAARPPRLSAPGGERPRRDRRRARASARARRRGRSRSRSRAARRSPETRVSTSASGFTRRV